MVEGRRMMTIIREGWVAADRGYQYWKAGRMWAIVEHLGHSWRLSFHQPDGSIRHSFEDANAPRDYVQQKVEFKLRGRIV